MTEENTFILTNHQVTVIKAALEALEREFIVYKDSYASLERPASQDMDEILDPLLYADRYLQKIDDLKEVFGVK